MRSHPCQGQDRENGVTPYAQNQIMRSVVAGAKMYATHTNTRCIFESMPQEVLDDEHATAQLKLAIQAKLVNLKSKFANYGNDSSDLWYLNMNDEASSASLLAALLDGRWSTVLSRVSVERVVKAYMQVPENIVGVEVSLARKHGVKKRHQELLLIKFEFDSDDVATITCPTGYHKGHGLPGRMFRIHAGSTLYPGPQSYLPSLQVRPPRVLCNWHMKRPRESAALLRPVIHTFINNVHTRPLTLSGSGSFTL